MRKILLPAIILLSSSLTQAVNLHEALTSGYNNHEDLKIIRTDFLNEIEEFPRAVADFMPKISARLSSTNTKTKRTGNLSQTIDGTTVDGSSYSRNLTLEQPLFNGGSSVAGLKAAQSSYRSSRSAYYSKEQDAILDEIKVYLECVAGVEKYNISKISVKSNRTQLDAMKEKFRLGESTETEVASAETGLSTANANLALAYAELEAAKANFTRVFALEANSVKMPELATGLPANLDELIDISLVSNPNINASMHNTKAAKAGEYAAKAQLLPRVSFNAQTGNTTYDPQKSETGNVNNHSVTTSLNVVIPILERGGVEYSDIRRAKYQTRKSVIKFDDQTKQVKANCKANWEAFNAAKNRLTATMQGVKSAEVAYDGMIQEEKLGSKTIVDVLNFEDRLNNARNERVAAQKDLVLASYRIKSLMGELTAEKMQLPVQYFDPDKEFKKIKLRIVGF